MQQAIVRTGAGAAPAIKSAMVEWIVSNGPVEYPDAVDAMETRVAAIRAGEKDEAVWLLEHPPIYTAGTSAKDDDLLEARFPVYRAGRGGQYTYHGPGQRIAYVMLDLAARYGGVPDLRDYVFRLEGWLIATLAEFGIRGERREGRVGIWVATPEGEEKIAALGVRVRRGVSYHGVALNVAPDLTHFGGIVPCGLGSFGVTSIAERGGETDLGWIDQALVSKFDKIFDDPRRYATVP